MLDKLQIKRVLKDHCSDRLMSFEGIAQTLIEHEHEILKKFSHKYYSSKFGSKKRYIKALKRYIHFCNECGEYITKDFGCSNPWCPERIS